MATTRLFAAAGAAWLWLTPAAPAQTDVAPPPSPGPAQLQPPFNAPPPPPGTAQPVFQDAFLTPLPRTWEVVVDPFIMWFEGARFPVLLTTGDVNVDINSGVLGQPATRTLKGGGPIGGDPAAGIRLIFAHTFGDDDRGSIDLSGFLVQTITNTTDISSNSDGNPVLVRPFYNPNTGKEAADYRAYPDYMRGMTHDSLVTNIYGAEGNVRWDLVPTTPINRFGFGMLVGARYFQLDENYSSNDTSIDLPALGTGNTFRYSDTFATNNTFVGAQIGATGKWRVQKLSFDVTGKLIGGNLNQSVNISGATQLTDASGTSAVDHSQGLYAMPSNIGRYSRDTFALGGEVGLKLGLRFTETFRLNIGYTFFTLGNVVRPGDQIDRTVNIQPLFSGGGVGVARPTALLRDGAFSTHMFNVGFEFWF